MKRKDELKIEILSNIKDEIIDKQSAKRYALMNRKRRPKWIIPSSVAAVLLIAIMIPLFIVLFSKQVPVYEGMTVSTTYQPNKNTASSGGVTMLSASGSDRTQIDFLKNDNGNHNGHNKKPVEDIVDDEFSSSLTIPNQHMYYAKPSQDIYITVHISNPDSFEILSFTLNGKKYSSYMFEDGSDMENLILKVTVPESAEGITEYTIDAIKYVDGTDIKDVIMEGDRTIKVGVYSENQPNASVTQTETGFNVLSAKISISDELELIKRSGGTAYAIICNDEDLIDSKEIGDFTDFSYSYTGLELDTEYRLAVVALYDSFDGTGMNLYTLYESEINTQALLEITSLESKVSEISGEFVLNSDDDVTATNAKIELYLGHELIKTTTDSAFKFTDLKSYTDYTLKFSLDYDLGDGKGEQKLTATRQIKTKPDISALSCKVLNTSAIYEGDTIYLKVTINNPDAIAITSVTVNGIDCPVIGESTGNSLNIEVVNNGQFGAGRAMLKLESINSAEYRAPMLNDMSDDLFIYGEFAIEDVYFVNSKFEKVEWAFPSEEIFVMVSLKNPTGYKVISIDGYTNIKKYDDEHYYFSETSPSSDEWTISGNWSHSIKVTKAEYKDPLNENGEPISLELEYGIEAYLLVVDSDEIKYISSPKELMNISGGYYYELTQDIDLDGVNWKPIENFTGVLNGKGYTIKNLSIVGTGPSDYIGLFGILHGGVENLNFSGVNIIVNRDRLKCGAICGVLGDQHSTREAFIKNCFVDSTCTIVGNTDYDTYDFTEYSVGGLVGSIDSWSGKIIDCTNSASVSGNARYVGGIAGGGGPIINCKNTGNIKGCREVGGIVGGTGDEIINCENSGTISGGFNVGGIVGDAYRNVKGCKNSGTVNGIEIFFGPEGYNGASIGGIAGTFDGNIIIGQSTGIINCENVGDITGYNEVGGIVGYTSGKTEGCINSGNISAKDKDSLGGIAGGSYQEIIDCQDNGTITVIPYN